MAALRRSKRPRPGADNGSGGHPTAAAGAVCRLPVGRPRKRQRPRAQVGCGRSAEDDDGTPSPAVAAPTAPEALQCGICFDAIKERGRLDTCDHGFCFDCIDRWSATANCCPLCRRAFHTITNTALGTAVSVEDHDERGGRLSVATRAFLTHILLLLSTRARRG